MRWFFAAAAAIAMSAAPQQPRTPTGVRLADLTWVEAESRLTRDTVILIPIAAGALEQGPHMTLGADLVLAEYLAHRVAAAADVVVVPPLTYHRYPGLLEYPGSSSLALDTARDLTVDVVRSFARYGPRRFYGLVTAPSTGRALDPAARALAQEGILLAYTSIAGRLDRASAAVRKQAGGGHADEVKTSMLLHVDPGSVDMSRAAKDYAPSTGDLQLARKPEGRGMYSPSGVWGDATLATAEKGKAIVEALVAGILQDVETVRRAVLPTALRPSPSPSDASHPAAPPPPPRPPASRPSGCTPGDERTIIRFGDAYATAWANGDAESFAALWSPGGDIVHPDGLVERTRETIRDNRRETFRQPEYRGSRHPLTLHSVRCLGTDVAVADGKWELRGVSDASGKSLPRFEGLCTLVVRRFPPPPGGRVPAAGADVADTAASSSAWLIEAYRYTVKPTAVPLPAWSSRPGIQIVK